VFRAHLVPLRTLEVVSAPLPAGALARPPARPTDRPAAAL